MAPRPDPSEPLRKRIGVLVDRIKHEIADLRETIRTLGRVNSSNPDVPMMPRAAYERVVDPSYVSPLMNPTAPETEPAGSPDEPAVEAAPSPLDPAADPLVDSILRQTRDNAKVRDAREAARAGQ